MSSQSLESPHELKAFRTESLLYLPPLPQKIESVSPHNRATTVHASPLAYLSLITPTISSVETRLGRSSSSASRCAVHYRSFYCCSWDTLPLLVCRSLLHMRDSLSNINLLLLAPSSRTSAEGIGSRAGGETIAHHEAWASPIAPVSATFTDHALWQSKLKLLRQKKAASTTCTSPRSGPALPTHPWATVGKSSFRTPVNSDVGLSMRLVLRIDGVLDFF